VYFLNHNSWWDGLIPLYLNENFFHQKARAIMEDKQMKKYAFFSKIGAFSIDIKNPRSTLTSLRYALKSLDRDKACLFIYPEGKLTPVSQTEPVFKKGLSWLYKKSDNIDFVPIGIYMHTFRSAKPELYISIGSSVVPYKNMGNNELTNFFQHKLYKNLTEMRGVAGYSDSGFAPQF
jgi:1-acyl-sn-glycerol-3-phosphate acyltransferase